MKTFTYIMIIIGFIVVTFFGLGPVLIADGSSSERIITLLIVLILFLILGWVYIHLTKRK